MTLTTAELAAAIERGKRMKLPDRDIAVQLGITVAEVNGGPPPANPPPKSVTVAKPKTRRVTWNEPTEAELDALIEQRRGTMPGGKT
jgi:hypothetical protein